MTTKEFDERKLHLDAQHKIKMNELITLYCKSNKYPEQMRELEESNNRYKRRSMILGALLIFIIVVVVITLSIIAFYYW